MSSRLVSGRVVVTGSGGFVGQGLTSFLLASGYAHHPLSRSHLAAFLAGQPTNQLYSGHWLGAGDVVVHLAARAHVLDEPAAGPLALYRSVNRDMTLALARAAAVAGARRFVFVSSIRVNGGSTLVPFRANDDPAPEEPYAISKHEAELGLWQIARETGLEVVIVRPPLVYGPEVKANFRRLLKLSASGLPLPLGSVDGVRTLVNIWNLCDLLIRCIGHPAAPGNTFLAGDGDDIALPDLIRSLAAGMHRPCRVFAAPPGLVRSCAALAGKVGTFDKLTASLQVDISETRRVLDWTPPVSLAEGLARTAQWYEKSVLGAKSA